MLLPYVSADSTWTGPLVCDPAMRAALFAEPDTAVALIVDYYATGDASALPDADATRITLRPLTTAQDDQAEAIAGPPDAYGESVDAARARAIIAAQVDGSTLSEAYAAFIDSQPVEAQAAYQRHLQRQRRLMRARVTLALVDVSGWSADEVADADARDTLPTHGTPEYWGRCIDALGDMRHSFVVEASSHLQRIGSLTHMGKARSSRRSGTAPISPGADGSASSASGAPAP
jgi:hypothetical protein